MVTTARIDRALGAVVGSACGDALGAPYEFQPSVADDHPIVMRAGGVWERGEWTDDTSMAVPILEAVAQRRSLTDPSTLADIVDRWVEWKQSPSKDIGIQTSAVLGGLAGDHSEAAALRQSKRVHDEQGRSGGNGSLMRTGPVALAYLDDPAGLAAAARRVSDLTHYDPDTGDACALWSLAIRHAIVTGELELRAGIGQLSAQRRERWLGLIADAEGRHPRHYESRSGWVVASLQAAWAAVTGAATYQEAVERAVRVGWDTDTVAAIAGALAGAHWGYSAIPSQWLRDLHGWPGWREADLVSFAERAVSPVTAAD